MHKPAKKSFIAHTILAVRRRWHSYFRLSGIKYPDQVESIHRGNFYFIMQCSALFGILFLWLWEIGCVIHVFWHKIEPILGTIVVFNLICCISVIFGTLPLLNFFFEYSEERRIISRNLFFNLLYGANITIFIMSAIVANWIRDKGFKAAIIDPILNAL